MKNQPENKKEAPGKSDNEGKMKEGQDAGPLGQENYSSSKNQSGKNTSPDPED